MLRIVLDTNVLISAIVYGGKPRVIFNNVIAGRTELALSWPIIEEVRDVLMRSKFNYPEPKTRLIINELEKISNVVTPQQELRIIENDPDDNRILECAVEADADYIVSGDRHLLDLEKYEDIKIVTPAEFLEKHHAARGHS